MGLLVLLCASVITVIVMMTGLPIDMYPVHFK